MVGDNLHEVRYIYVDFKKTEMLSQVCVHHGDFSGAGLQIHAEEASTPPAAAA